MHPSPLALLLLSACSATFAPLPAGDRPPPEDTNSAPDSEPPDTGTVQVGDSTVDEVPSPEDFPAPPLCAMDLLCDEAIPNEPKITCAFRVADGYGRLAWEGPAGVELHGRSSLGFPKPQYSVELRDALGDPVEADLLGMGAESDWILNGAYIDRALFRNKLAFDVFRAFGERDRYAPESAYCELTVNGAWVGVYFLTERIKRDASRLDLAADGGTGSSFVVKLDDDSAGVLANSQGYGYWKLVYPSAATATSAQGEGVRAALSAWQAALVSAEPGHPETGIFASLDMDSAIDFVLLHEAFKNNDAYYLSVYLSRDLGGRMFLSPWDMDLTLGQPLYNDNELSTGWILYRPPWVANMAQVPGFREALAARWRELRAGVMATDALLDRITAYRAILGDTVYANFEVWPIEEIQFGGRYLYPVTSYDEEYEKVREWLPERLAWVDASIDAW